MGQEPQGKTKPESNRNRYVAADGYSVWHWPEFQALVKRLGIDLEAPTLAVTIRVHHEEIVTVIHEFRGLDLETEKE